jgi:flagellar basal-body rod protein FlgB
MFNTDSTQKMKILTNALVQRQELLSNNLANISTENYVRQDIDFASVLSGMKNNISSDAGENEKILASSRYRDYGNKMTLESEMSKLYDNHLRYLLMVKSVSHHYDHMKKALEVRAS